MYTWWFDDHGRICEQSRDRHHRAIRENSGSSMISWRDRMTFFCRTNEWTLRAGTLKGSLSFPGSYLLHMRDTFVLRICPFSDRGHGYGKVENVVPCFETCCEIFGSSSSQFSSTQASEASSTEALLSMCLS